MPREATNGAMRSVETRNEWITEKNRQQAMAIKSGTMIGRCRFGYMCRE